MTPRIMFLCFTRLLIAGLAKKACQELISPILQMVIHHSPASRCSEGSNRPRTVPCTSASCATPFSAGYHSRCSGPKSTRCLARHLFVRLTTLCYSVSLQWWIQELL